MGRGSETVGRRGPRISPKVSRIIRGTCGAQSSNLELQKICLGPPPPLNSNKDYGNISIVNYIITDVINVPIINGSINDIIKGDNDGINAINASSDIIRDTNYQ